MTTLTLHPVQYQDSVRSALLEELGVGGDLTTDAVIGHDETCAAGVFARSPGRIAGIEVAACAFGLLDRRVTRRTVVEDGSDVELGDRLLTLSGPARAVLTAERTALNFLGHLSGIATLTRAYVAAVDGTSTRVVCTRKTTPGLRALEKYAVRCGGGANHRFGLDDAVLIKDNHLAAAGSVRRALELVRAAVGHTVMVELEVDTLTQLEEALAFGVDAVLLDNMSVAQLREAVALVDGRAVVEASGGITLDTIAEVAATGVDLISVGALTHSAPALDLSMELEIAR
jgi:nicotinate-nucleotide pyrophosphorylase (carboxylating)